MKAIDQVNMDAAYSLMRRHLDMIKRSYILYMEFKHLQEKIILTVSNNLDQDMKIMLKWIEDQESYLIYMKIAREEMENNKQ